MLQSRIPILILWLSIKEHDRRVKAIKQFQFVLNQECIELLAFFLLELIDLTEGEPKYFCLRRLSPSGHIDLLRVRNWRNIVLHYSLRDFILFIHSWRVKLV